MRNNYSVHIYIYDEYDVRVYEYLVNSAAYIAEIRRCWPGYQMYIIAA